MPELTSRTGNLIFVDCEARGTSPVNGILTEFGAVHYDSRASFHGRLYESSPDPECPAIPVVGARIASDASVASALGEWVLSVCKGRPVLVSDNPAYDFMWIAALCDRADLPNPFGHSGRRISDFWAGLTGEWGNTQKWKAYRQTRHDHNPVHDAMGNCEAFATIMRMHDEGVIRS